MNRKKIGVLCAVAGALLLGPLPVFAAPSMMDAGMKMDKSVLSEKRQAVQGVSADAMAILSALERDPTLAGQLAKNPEGAEALLRARGAARAEHIIVTPNGAERTITITIKIDHVTIEIVIKL